MQRQFFAFSPIPFVLLMAVAGCSTEAAEVADAAEPAAAQASVSREVSVSEARTMLEGGEGPAVIDVRTPEEFEAGHIDGALNINFRSEDFAAEIAKLDKSQPYILHCKTGGRSAKALAEMEAQGFENIAHMVDGYDGWSAASAENAGE